ncbi:hypothetical protein M758_11G030800 [Ceratodon purpureus]|nr:hypothetical protein M758_11G030800 [Ceratodon purpureus]
MRSAGLATAQMLHIFIRMRLFCSCAGCLKTCNCATSFENRLQRFSILRMVQLRYG